MLSFGILIIANVGMVVAAALLSWRCFFSKTSAHMATLPTKPQDPPFWMWLGPGVLALLSLLLGIAPQLIIQAVSAAVSAIAGANLVIELGLWHGLTPMLALSVLTLVLGIMLYKAWPTLRQRLASYSALDKWGPDALYDYALQGLALFSAWQTQRIQTGSLRHYMAMSIGFVTVTTLISLVATQGLTLPFTQSLTMGKGVLLPLLLILTSIMMLRSHSFVQGIVSADATGFVVAVIFLMGGAPDLAFTQFSVESLSIVILLAVIGHMPFQKADPRTTSQKQRDAVIALLFGLMFTLMLFAVGAEPFNTQVSDFFREASYPLAHGRNLVNVIIVDFRALDTLGEIAVLALAAIAAIAVFFSTKAKGS